MEQFIMENCYKNQVRVFMTFYTHLLSVDTNFSFICSTEDYDRPAMIIGRSAGEASDYPYLASLFIYPVSSIDYVKQCAGSLISVKHVLTAASCFEPQLSIGYV
jgi:secreted trypsin-like serine protease